MEAIRNFLGLGVIEFNDLVIKSVFLLFTAIVVVAILVVWIKELRDEKKKIRAIIAAEERIDEVEGILRIHQKSGFKDIEQAAIDIVKIISRKAFLSVCFLFFSAVAFSQQYTDLFPDSRAPYRFRIYERETLAKKEIARIDTYWVTKQYYRQWMQGVYAYQGDTTNLIPAGYELEQLSCDTNIYLVSPAYLRYDTVYVLPTLKGFELWKQERGYK